MSYSLVAMQNQIFIILRQDSICNSTFCLHFVIRLLILSTDRTEVISRRGVCIFRDYSAELLAWRPRGLSAAGARPGQGC